MRRKDREITDSAQISALLDRAKNCTLGLTDGDEPYLVPLSFGHTLEDGKLVLYFHGARQGRKLELIEKNDKAFVSLFCDDELLATPDACGCTMLYNSVSMRGRIERCEDGTAGLNHIMRKYGYTGELVYDERVLARTLVLRFVADEVTAKGNRG